MHGKALLVAGIVSCCILMGCESNFDRFERFYKPVATRERVPRASAAPLRLVYSYDPDRDATLLRRDGYVLIGTTSFNGVPDLSYADRAVIAQAQKVGAALVLLKARSYNTLTSCCSPDKSLQVTSEGGASYFASYWAKADVAGTSEPR